MQSSCQAPKTAAGTLRPPPSPTCPCPDWLPSLGSQVPPPPSPAPPHRQPLNGERAGLRAPIPPSTTPLPLPPVISTRAKPHLYPESPHNFVSGLDPPPTSPPMTRCPSPSVFLRASPTPRIKRLLLSATLLCPAFPSPRMAAPRPGCQARAVGLGRACGALQVDPTSVGLSLLREGWEAAALSLVQ